MLQADEVLVVQLVDILLGEVFVGAVGQRDCFEQGTLILPTAVGEHAPAINQRHLFALVVLP